jgi:hypothetical protein
MMDIKKIIYSMEEKEFNELVVFTNDLYKARNATSIASDILENVRPNTYSMDRVAIFEPIDEQRFAIEVNTHLYEKIYK